MRVVSQVSSVRKARTLEHRPVALVPTMGALHAGHISLLQRGRESGGVLWMTLFVNPLQFGANEDLDAYPQPRDRDLQLAADAGVDLVFAPTAANLYPPDFASYVEPTGAARLWEGKGRPGHFRGVATIVTILFLICRPRWAFFGQKDYQQLQVIRRLVRDLHLDIQIVGCPTIREPDGLALSSRNIYLDRRARQSATILQRALQAARMAYQTGVSRGDDLVTTMCETVAKDPAASLEYAAVVEPESLQPMQDADDSARLLIAGHVAGVHLIDNMALVPERLVSCR